MKYELAQINPKTADIQGNKEKIQAKIENTNTDVIAFPEMSLTGYCLGDRVGNDEFLKHSQDTLAEIAENTGETAAVIGFLDGEENGPRYNAAAIVQNGEIKDKIHKQLLPNYRYFDDKRYFEPGEPTTPTTLEIDGDEIDLGVSICEDMWDSEYERAPISDLAEEGADAIININASPFEPGKTQGRQNIIEQHIEDAGIPFLYVNTVGAADVGKNILAFDGESLAYNGDGQLVGVGKKFEEDTLTLDPETANQQIIEDRSWEKETYDALTMALEDYMEKTGFDKIIEPVSGGIDSSLGLAVCADAIGPENVIAYNMPSQVNSQQTKDVAEKLSENLGVEYRILPVEDAYQQVIDTYEENVDEIEQTVARENIYARTRGMFAMLETNENPGTMLVSNGNQTEMALGYATLYGDMNGGLSILGDVSKNDVYSLARHVNEDMAKR